MNNLTRKIVKWILVFFAIILFLGLSVFLYKKFVPRNNTFNIEELMKDSNTEEILKKKEEEIEKYKENLRVDQENNRDKDFEYLQCKKGEQYFDHNTWTEFYSKRFVTLREDCKNYQIKKRCDNGEWLGDEFYNQAVCEQSVDCVLDSGEVLKNGESKKFYFSETVQYGEKCEDYVTKRTCNDTYLKGDSRYKYTECRVSEEGICQIDENIVANKRSHLFYSVDKVEYTDKCQNYSQVRLCSDGKLFGDEKYKYWDCNVKIPKKCTTIDGRTVEHKQIIKLYSSPSGGKSGCAYYVKQAQCINGSFDQPAVYKYTSCVE